MNNSAKLRFCTAVASALLGIPGPSGACLGVPPVECGDEQYPQPFHDGFRICAGMWLDLNGDGTKELLLKSTLGLGTFREERGVLLPLQLTADSTASVEPREMVPGDFDGDGDQDIAAVNRSSSTISYFRNLGGVLQPPITYGCGSGTRQIAAGDLNGDGKDEVVSAARSPALVYIYRGGNNGPLAALTLTAPSPVWGVAMTDIDNDGDLDIVAACNPDAVEVTSLVVYRNDGNFEFTTLPAQTVPFRAADLATSDFDGNGTGDLVVLPRPQGGNNGCAILYSSGGNFGTPQLFNLSNVPYVVRAADLTGDGRPELVFALMSSAKSSISVRYNDGTGGFGPEVTFFVGIGATEMTLIDVDQDGQLDAILSDVLVEPESYTIVKGRPGGSFATSVANPLPFSSSSFALGDIDGDGDDDAVVQQDSQHGLRVLRCDGNGRYSVVQALPGLSPTETPPLLLADLDRDGDLDIAIAWAGNSTIELHLNDGSGSFGPAIAFTCSGVQSLMRAGDLNGDGYPDLVVTTSAAPFVRVLMNSGSAGIGFGPSAGLLVGGTLPVDIEMGDMDGDGALDLVTLRNDNMQWWRNDGNGGFSGAQLISPYARGSHVELVDINHDGLLDAVSLVRIPNWNTPIRLGVFFNQGAFGFTQGPPMVVDEFATTVLARDLDGDCQFDLLIGTSRIPGLLLYRGRADGFWDPVQSYYMPAQNNLYLLGRANLDERLDIFSMQPSTLLVSRSMLCPASGVACDLNNDGMVNGNDLSILLSQWGPVEHCNIADVNGDGAVDGMDLAALLGAWGS